MINVYWRTIFRPNLWRVITIVLTALLASLAEVAGFGLILPVLSLFSSPNTPRDNPLIQIIISFLSVLGWATSPDYLLFTLLFVAVVLMVVRNVVVVINGYVIEITTWRVHQQVTRQLFRAYLSADYQCVAAVRRGEMLQNIQAPADSAASSVLAAGGAIVSLLEITVSVLFLFWLSWWAVVLIGITAIALRYMLQYFVQNPLVRYTHVRYQSALDGTAHLVEGLDGLRVIKTYSLLDKIMARLNPILARHFRYLTLFGVLARVPASLLEVSGALLLLVFVGAGLVTPLFRIEFATLATLTAVLLRLLPSVSRLNALNVSMAQNFSSVKMIDRLLNELPKEKEGGTQMLASRINQLSLEHVHFAYPSREEDALCDVNMMFARGKMVALTGRSGAGKSTIADLFIRLYTPTQGAILADGVNIQDVPLIEWRRRIGYVSQDTFLFNASLRDNITLFDDQITEEQMLNCARLAQVDAFVNELAEGYNTTVGERGVQLSGGQRQRVAVARALVRQPDILVMDEATSALDNLTEQAFQQAISHLRQHCILIVIAHRLSTIRDADQIIVLGEGRVLESGVHESLMVAHGIYYQLNTSSDESK